MLPWLLRSKSNRVRKPNSSLCWPSIVHHAIADNEELRVHFAEKANQVGAYVEKKNADLTDLNIQNQGTLEEQLAALKAFQQEVAGYEAEFEACEVANQNAQAALVFDNPHTSYTMDVSRRGGEGREGVRQLVALVYVSPPLVCRHCVLHGDS